MKLKEMKKIGTSIRAVELFTIISILINNEESERVQVSGVMAESITLLLLALKAQQLCSAALLLTSLVVVLL